jgi:8-oxo-dGTP pyrophosphatase MutT (NUDIX family)
MKYIHISCGAVVLKLIQNEINVLIMFRERTKSWHLPKGTQLDKETKEETALREVFEETGYKVKLIDYLGFLPSKFLLNGETIEKETYYFTATPLDQSKNPDHEHDRIEWKEISLAKHLLRSNIIYEDEALILGNFEEFYKKNLIAIE